MPLRPPPEASLHALDTPDGLNRLDQEELSALDAHWRATMSLAVGRICIVVDVRHRHHDWIRAHGADLPEVAEWTWSQ